RRNAIHPSGPDLLSLDADVAYDFAPLRRFQADERGVVFGPPAHDLGTDQAYLFAHVRRIERAQQLAVQNLDILLRRAGRNEEAVPHNALDAGQPGLSNGRHVLKSSNTLGP